MSVNVKEYKTKNIRGLNIADVTLSEALEVAQSLLVLNGSSCIFTPNSEIAQMCIDNEETMELFNGADMLIPDGEGIIIASKILKTPLKEKVAGIDLAEALVRESVKNGYKIYFFGSKPGVAEEANKRLGEKYPGFCACGYRDGYFNEEDEAKIISDINETGADCVFVCLGAVKQEKWMAENKDKLCAKLLLGLGGSLDVFAGSVKRAPKIFIKLKLEWFYRLIKDPKRFGRMMSLPKFIFSTMIHKNKTKGKK